MKKAISILLTAALIILQIPAAVSAESTNPFTDVKDSAYYYEPVLWAVSNNVTSGTSSTTFSPDLTCTRAQVVTFLWRAAGEPAPKNGDNPFNDVKAGEYYYNAVLWAVEHGVTSGMSANTFAPDAPCTRGQVVTFQWRAADQPDPGTAANPFRDVKVGQYFCNAVLWAVDKGITAGTSAVTFEPDSTCTRGQIVTFLFRQMGKNTDTDTTDADKYFAGNAKVIEKTAVEESDDVITEAECDDICTERGFTGDVMSEYDMDGEFLAEEEVISDTSRDRHPMYYMTYIADNGDVWTVFVTGDRVMAYPASYNLHSGNDVITVVSEEKSIVNYDVVDNTYYEIIPNADAVCVKTVNRVDAKTLEALSVGELDAPDEADESVSVNNMTAPAQTLAGCVTTGGTEDGPVVVSMGDSYSSGEGDPNFIGWTGYWESSILNKEFLAHRSENSWSSQLKIDGVTMKNNKNWYFVAASGALTKDYASRQSYTVKKGLNWQNPEMDPQFDILDSLQKQRKQVDYVTMTVGGNDVDFSGIVTKITLGNYITNIVYGGLQKMLNEKIDYYDTTLKGDLRTLYTKTAEKTDYKAAIIVAGYPRLFDETGKGLAIHQQEAEKVNDTVTLFNVKIRSLVEKLAEEDGLPIYFSDVETAFKNHGAYSKVPAINPIWLKPKAQDLNHLTVGSQQSIHPNAYGISLYRDCVQKTINSIENNKPDSTGFDILEFGSYEQDNDLSNGAEPIQWYVLDKKDGKALVISKYALDSVFYDYRNDDNVRWEDCYLRSWLNEDFYNAAFSSAEKSRIVTTTVENPDSYWKMNSDNQYTANNTGFGMSDPYRHVTGCDPTQDKIFALSLDEAAAYFKTDASRMCLPTPYTIFRGGEAYSGNVFAGKGYTFWWLRSQGTYGSSAAFVNCDGTYNHYASQQDSGTSVRPVMWVNIGN